MGFKFEVAFLASTLTLPEQNGRSLELIIPSRATYLFLPPSPYRLNTFQQFLHGARLSTSMRDNNFTRPTCTVTNSLFSLYKKKPQEIFKAAENASFFMMA